MCLHQKKKKWNVTDTIYHNFIYRYLLLENENVCLQKDMSKILIAKLYIILNNPKTKNNQNVHLQVDVLWYIIK